MVGAITVVDAHVHVHPGANIDALLDAAAENLGNAAREQGASQWQCVLMLAEMKQRRWFDSIVDVVGSASGRWSYELLPGDDISVRARCGERDLTIVAGRQVVTSEGLEVLTLGTREVIPDRLPLTQTLDAANAGRSLAVLPWGAGKWLGARGKLVDATIAGVSATRVFPGDNGGRPGFWPDPAVFKVAADKNCAVVSGTDPLPLPGEEARVGTFGFWMPGTLPSAAPGRTLLERLRTEPSTSVHSFGKLQGTVQFIRNQTALRLHKAPVQ